MKTLVVLSDTHGNRRAIEKLYPLFAENDYVIHLGDGNRDMAEIYRAFPQKTFVCRGNCDFSAPYAQEEWELSVEGVKFFFCHGHSYGVKTTLERLKDEALHRGAKAALYGHTHIARVEEEDGVLLVNPGCAGLYTSQPSYAYIVVNGEKVTATVVPLH